MVCKLSIVIPGGQHAGAILDAASIPEEGDELQLGSVRVRVLEVRELLPPRGEFHFVHVTGEIIGPSNGSPAAGGSHAGD